MNSKLPNSAPKQPQTIQISDYGSQKSPSHDFNRKTLTLVFLQMSQKRPINLAEEMDEAIVLSKNRIQQEDNIKRVALR